MSRACLSTAELSSELFTAPRNVTLPDAVMILTFLAANESVSSLMTALRICCVIVTSERCSLCATGVTAWSDRSRLLTAVLSGRVLSARVLSPGLLGAVAAFDELGESLLLGSAIRTLSTGCADVPSVANECRGASCVGAGSVAAVAAGRRAV
jgi:hypothetical protein